MDTLIFLLIVAGLLAVLLDRPRHWVLGLVLAGNVAAVLMFHHHVSDSLGYHY
ncbi:DUF5993 family protein [Streptomyces sp. NPDC059063]|uniref:DUF5993 family protein n=1 Tax=unclassified Streptomyces TaxID=2593676 RepID=UPI0036A61D65